MLDQLTAEPVVKPQLGDAEVTAWQTKLLPLMVGMLIALTGFFCVSNIFQVFTLNNHIRQVGEPDLHRALDMLQVNDQTKSSERLDYAQWKAQALLEAYAMRYRYHQASVAIMARAYLIYLGFTTGMVLAMVGATFILGKLRESQSEVATSNSLLNLSITSASPGLILATLGTLLMLTTILARADVQVRDGALFLPRSIDTSAARPDRSRTLRDINEDAKRIEAETEGQPK